MRQKLLRFLKHSLKKSLNPKAIVLPFLPRRILQRYIFFSIFPYFFLGVFVLSLVNFVQYLSEFVELAIQYQASLWSVLKTVFYLIPFLMTFTMPIGALIGVILTLGHLSQNNEVLAIRINGVSYFQIFSPALFFGFCLFIFQLLFFQWILPWGNSHFLEEKYKMLQKNPLSQIQKQQQFSDGARELKIASINGQNIYGISFIDSQTNTLYYAKKGIIKPSINEDNLNIPITLYNATAMPFIFGNKTDDLSLQFFNEITVYIKAVNIQSIVPEGDELVGLLELRKIIKDQTSKNVVSSIKAFHKTLAMAYNIQKLSKQKKPDTEKEQVAAQNSLQTFQVLDQRILARDEVFLFQRKLAFCIDTLLMVILGIPMALFKKRHGRDIAIGLSVLCAFIFNLLLAFGSFSFKQGWLGPYMAAWLPGILIAILAGLLISWKTYTMK